MTRRKAYFGLSTFWFCGACLLAYWFGGACGEFGFSLALPFLIGEVGFSAMALAWFIYASGLPR